MKTILSGLKSRLAAATVLAAAAAPAQAQDFNFFDLFRGDRTAVQDNTPVARSGNGAAPYRGAVNLPALRADLQRHGFRLGQPIHIRIFKQERVLEVWFRRADGSYAKYRDYPIVAMSGTLGPKLSQGDHQAAEGFYMVGAGQMNAGSSYQASFNVGYPNAFDRAHGRTGGLIMVHGADNQDGKFKSVGCFAIRDIHDVFTIARGALNAGQTRFAVHSFPFRMTAANMARHAGNRWINFWRQMKPAYDHFENTRRVAAVSVNGRNYVVNNTATPVERDVAVARVETPEAASRTPRREPAAAALPLPAVEAMRIRLPARVPLPVRRPVETALAAPAPAATIDRLAMFSHAFAVHAGGSQNTEAWRDVYVCMQDGRPEFRRFVADGKRHDSLRGCRAVVPAP